MKRAYEKPQILFESFSVSTNIAGDCEGNPVGNPSRGSCPVISSSGDRIFDTAAHGCDYTPTQMGGVDDMWDGYCYHVPTEYNNLFNS
ncbi:MAG: hypothetical protein J6A88_01880 [Oscillospiraceae bacterium]|nr:hypothetical protein [Oscillospiraceae bacterium]